MNAASQPDSGASITALDLGEIRDQPAEAAGTIDHPDAPYNWAALSAQRVAERLLAEVERLHTWTGLMSLLDEHYPASVFPTEEDRADRDDGPRILSLIRHLDQADKVVQAARVVLGAQRLVDKTAMESVDPEELLGVEQFLEGALSDLQVALDAYGRRTGAGSEAPA